MRRVYLGVHWVAAGEVDWAPPIDSRTIYDELRPRMLGNIGVDFMLGAVPVVGDVLDFAWKANRKNARLLEQHLMGFSGLRPLRRR